MTTKSTKAAPAAETVDETAAAAAASAVTAQKVEYEPTTWADGSSGGTPITAAQLNRMETGIDSLATQNNALVDDVTSLGDSLSQIEVSDGHKVYFSSFTDSTGLALIFSIDGMQLQVKQDGLYYVDATGTPTAIWGISAK